MSIIHCLHSSSRHMTLALALSLLAGLAMSVGAMTPVQAAATATTCTENNHNGCTELSPTPPQDTVAVPPNIVLMLDDSGSMKWNFMPDLGFLEGVTLSQDRWGNSINTVTNNDALIASSNNGVYYNPTITYTAPPKATGAGYTSQTDLSNVPFDGFGVVTTDKVNLYTYDGADDYCDTSFYDYYGNYHWCSGSDIDYNTSKSADATIIKTYDETVNADYVGKWQCIKRNRSGLCTKKGWVNVLDKAADVVCQGKYDSNDGIDGTYTFNGATQDSDGNWLSGECKFNYTETETKTYNYFQYSTGPADGPYVVHYVAPASQGCGDLSTTTTPTCILDTDTSGVAAPAGVNAGANIANWFAYYHTRLLMAKSGLMTAFKTLQPTYRFGFASINANGKSNIPSSPAPYAFDNSSGSSGSSTNSLAVVQPYGLGSDSTSQMSKFWTWLANEKGNNGTPLRKSLQAVGEYYKTAQPWTTMPGDPGYTTNSTTKFACRASYTILTTDGFWNGGSPGVGNVDSTNGTVYTPPAGSTYTTTGYLAAQPFSDDQSNTLADVALKYWATDLSGLADEVAPNSADPAFWQHMTTFTMGLGFDPEGITPAGTTIQQIFAWAHGGTAITGFSWPTPSSDSINNIADLAHAAVNGHGDFFSVKSPQDLAAGFAKAIADISARNVAPKPASVNASVAVLGALAFSTGYNTGDWSGTLHAMKLKTDGTVSADAAWKAETQLDASYHTASGYSSRKVYSGAYATSGFDSFQLTAANVTKLDSVESTGLMTPSSTGATDTAAARINYLLGDPSNEGTLYRSRTSLLGAIIRSQPVYVSYPSSGYGSWPSGTSEAATDAETYDTFVNDNDDRAGTVYVGANDGMLHAFTAPAPVCTTTATATTCTYGNGGKELWAYVPRAVYANLGNLTSASTFRYRPTVDETPMTRDVYFSDKKWHTLLTGGVGLGGRGVYALDITTPTTFKAMWEFDSDKTMDAGCYATFGDCKSSDLGYTVSQPFISRLANGKWVVLVSNGYFPDCSTPDTPTNETTNCQNIANQVPKDSSGKTYSALFVIDAEDGKVLAELKTPTNITGVTSFGLASPVLGDYDNNQIDDVAFAGDVQGNLWRFDLSGSTPSSWKVTLAYKGLSKAVTVGSTTTNVQGQQPITTMPRLFPNPANSRFLVLFGTGKFLGVGDNSNATVQSLYAVPDQGNSTTTTAYTQSDLTQRYLHETIAPDTLADGSANPIAGATLRCITADEAGTCKTGTVLQLSTPGKVGWYTNLEFKTNNVTTNAGERVVVTPGAIFASNTVIFETLITGSASTDPCNPSTVGAFMALNAATGGTAGVSSLGGGNMSGGRINHARTSGRVSVVSKVGGGQAYLPGADLPGKPSTAATPPTLPPVNPPVTINAPLWRRRSWTILKHH